MDKILSYINLYFLILFLFLLCNSESALGNGGTQLQPEDVLKKYEIFLKRLETIEFTSSITVNLEMPNEHFKPTTVEAKIHRSKDRIKVESTILGDMNEKKHSIIQREEMINSEMHLTSYLYLEQNEYQVSADMQTFPRTQDSQTKVLSEKICFGNEFFSPDSNKTEPDSILAFLRKSKLTLGTKIDETSREFHLLSAKGDNFHIDIWFDIQNNDGSPSKIIYEFDTDKVTMYQPLRYYFEVQEFQKINDLVLPKKVLIIREKIVPLKRESFNPDDINMDTFSQKNEEIINLKNTGKRIEKIEVEWTNVILSKNIPDSVFKLEKMFHIPNGTEVYVKNVPQIEYVWFNGKIVAKTDEIALAIARGDHGFMPGPKNPRFWFMALGAILLLVGGGLKIRSMLKGEG